MPQPPTIAAIAAAAGVSKATASRALAGHPRVAPATRERVQACARSMGWRRSPQLESLTRRRWPDGRQPDRRRIAVLCGLDQLPYRADWERLAADLGLECELHRIDAATPDRYEDLLLRGFTGLILMGMVDGVPLPAQLERFCCLSLGPYHLDLPVHHMLLDWRQLLRDCLGELARRGYRRPGLCLVRHASDDYNALVADALAAAGRHLPDLRIPPACRYRGGDDPAAFFTWLHQHEPDVVVGNFETHYWLLRDAGIAMPAQRGFCSLVLPDTETPISGMHCPARSDPGPVLRFLLHCLLREERGPQRDPWTILLRSHWHPGTTVRSLSSGSGSGVS